MDHTISRSEKKRRAKNIENLAGELVALSPADIAKLACDDFLKADIRDAGSMKAGARKRQIKYITKQLRNSDFEPLLDFLVEKKGSKLKETRDFHELERLRDDIISEAIVACREAEHLGRPFDSSWHSELIVQAAEHYERLDADAIKIAAIKFAKIRKPAYSREIFRILKAAQEQQRFRQA